MYNFILFFLELNSFTFKTRIFSEVSLFICYIKYQRTVLGERVISDLETLLYVKTLKLKWKILVRNIHYLSLANVHTYFTHRGPLSTVPLNKISRKS